MSICHTDKRIILKLMFGEHNVKKVGEGSSPLWLITSQLGINEAQ